MGAAMRLLVQISACHALAYADMDTASVVTRTRFVTRGSTTISPPFPSEKYYIFACAVETVVDVVGNYVALKCRKLLSPCEVSRELDELTYLQPLALTVHVPCLWQQENNADGERGCGVGRRWATSGWSSRRNLENSEVTPRKTAK